MRGPFIVNAEGCVGFFERFLTPWYNSDPWQDILCQFNMVRSCNTICGPTPGHWTLKLFVQIQIYVWADRVPVWPLGHREEASKCQKEERPKIRFSSSDKTHKSVFSSRKKSVRNGALGCKLWGGGGGGGISEQKSFQFLEKSSIFVFQHQQRVVSLNSCDRLSDRSNSETNMLFLEKGNCESVKI